MGTTNENSNFDPGVYRVTADVHPREEFTLQTVL